MGGSSSQPRTDQVHSPINAFSLEDMYTPAYSEPFEDNTGYWQPPNPYEASAEQVATSPTKKKKATRNRQKRMVQSEDAPRQTPWTMQEEIALCKGWLAVSENSKQDDVPGNYPNDNKAGTKLKLLGKRKGLNHRHRHRQA
ncbi:hypothetical protein Tco_0945939 [Tanacetum coccineum]